jgi:hypothetical protein
MTSAEYRTLREACGLSKQNAATFHNVALRTIEHWEAGKNPVPDGAAEELRLLDLNIDGAVQHKLDRFPASSQAKPFTLKRHRTAEEYVGSRHHRLGLPFPCDGVVAARAADLLKRKGERFVIFWADPAF